MRFLLTFGLLFLLGIGLFAQGDTGSLETYLNDYLLTLPDPDSNDYTNQSAAQGEIWQRMILAVAEDRLGDARSHADSVNYRILEFSDTAHGDLTRYLLIEELPNRMYYWGTQVYNPGGCRKDLVIQAPHPRYDSNTGKQGIFCFIRNQASWLMLSGTHRCNGIPTSPCSGTTSVCGSSGPYRWSDQAHSVESAFQNSTRILFDSLNTRVFVQLHGFGKQASDPYIIASNGTRSQATKDFVSLIVSELERIDTVLDSRIAHVDTGWTRLIGFTNTQGRYINKSTDACLNSASNSTDRFVHLEQERTRLRADSSGWDKVRQAFDSVFICYEPQDSVPDSIPSSISQLNAGAIRIYPNPGSDQLIVRGEGLTTLSLYSMDGRLLIMNRCEECSEMRLNSRPLAVGVYLLELHGKHGKSNHRWIRN